jgi:hypothetical protein
MEIIKCFIASPSDTNNERQICDKVLDELNKSLGDIYQFRLEPIKWETDTRPSFGTDGQDVINKQIGDNYNIFIGIMWKKFGTPTGRAGSGTEEEFQRAYERFKGDPNLEIAFYFNTEPPESIDDIDPIQFAKVKAFKSQIHSLGGLTWPYKGVLDFEQHLRRHLTKYLNQKYKNESEKKKDIAKESESKKVLQIIFDKRLNEALRAFSSQPTIWIDPILSRTNEISENPDINSNNKIVLSEIIQSPTSLFIKAPPQFGLTCLAHYFVKEAWTKDSLWIYIDAKSAKAHNVENLVKRECESLNQKIECIDCIILDSWNLYLDKSIKLIKNLSQAYPSIPIIVMETIDDSKFFEEQENEDVGREFRVLHLLALTRSDIRKLIIRYNQYKSIGDEDKILRKLTSDLENLNIHRTPLNCLTLLKVSEKHFDESPVNRTKMLEMVLFILFDLNNLPTYKSKPDVKDCEFVLGKFCRKLIERDNYEFSRDEFIKDLKEYCRLRLIALDVDTVFDVLSNNQILVRNGLSFVFRSSYWIFYFGAKEMHNDAEFAEQILKSKKYISFPEIIEFYTGIDRKREDALKILTLDIAETIQAVENKVGLPDDILPFKQMKWEPTAEGLAEIQKEIGEDVKRSGLPESVKDQYADESYNQIRPYTQTVGSILEKYSLIVLMRKVRACARALRNSDFVEPEIKRNLLKELLSSWEQISKVLLALSPILAKKGFASFEGAGFSLSDKFSESYEDRLNEIINALSFNVVKLFKDDIYSNKIGPLLYDRLLIEKNDLKKHQLITLLVFERPEEWKSYVERYIVALNKNSYFLSDLVGTLHHQYKFGFMTSQEKLEVEFLIKKGLAKHEFQVDNPGLDKIKKIPTKILNEKPNDES